MRSLVFKGVADGAVGISHRAAIRARHVREAERDHRARA
jgi:hypothetical protein